MENILKGTTILNHLFNSNEQTFNILKRLIMVGNKEFTDSFIEKQKIFLNEIKILLDLVKINVYDDIEDYDNNEDCEVNIKDELKKYIDKINFLIELLENESQREKIISKNKSLFKLFNISSNKKQFERINSFLKNNIY